MERVAILGAGTMGHSIAISVAWANLEVKLYGVDNEDIKRAEKAIDEKLEFLVGNELMTSLNKSEIVGRIHPTVYLEDAVKEATFIIEAAPENLQLKQDLYRKLDGICGEDVILASNTSGLSPTVIAEKTSFPERVIVTHFWNPGHLIPLVEVVRGEKTSDKTVERSMKLLTYMNKKPIEVKKDILGSVVNRLQYALFREAQYILEQGVATIEDIDKAVVYSIGRRLPVTGPFMTADMGGLDVFNSISTYLFEDLSVADRSLERMSNLVASNKLGQKNGEGFYNWTPEFSKEMNEKREKVLVDWLKKDLEITNDKV